jgi:hypothetical protein
MKDSQWGEEKDSKSMKDSQWRTANGEKKKTVNQWRTANEGQPMGRRKIQKDKQLSTKHYTEN